MSERFVLDERIFHLHEVAHGINQYLDTVLDIVEECARHGCCYPEGLFWEEVKRECLLYDLYDQDGDAVSRDVQERIAVVFAMLRMLPERVDPVDVTGRLEVGIGRRTSVLWAVEQCSRGHMMSAAVVTRPSGPQQSLQTVSIDGKDMTVWFVSSTAHSIAFFRWIAAATRSDDELAIVAEAAFPQLRFVPGVLSGIKDMSRPFVNIVADIVRHLGVLSDMGAEIFEGDRRGVSQKFASMGLDVSDENGRTKSSRDARVRRTRVYLGVEYVCWWHSKLRPDRDRIYFSPDGIVPAGGIVVGVCVRHL